jgi:hypothetical protein
MMRKAKSVLTEWKSCVHNLGNTQLVKQIFKMRYNRVHRI